MKYEYHRTQIIKRASLPKKNIYQGINAIHLLQSTNHIYILFIISCIVIIPIYNIKPKDKQLIIELCFKSQSVISLLLFSLEFQKPKKLV